MSEPMTLIMADDEPLARERVRRFLAVEPGYRLVGEAASGPEAAALIRELRPEVALLDIRLPGLDGFEVLDSLSHRRPPAVIFMTAAGDHSVDAYHAGAVDFLVKPFDGSRFRVALDRARTCVNGLRTTPTTSAQAGRIAVKSGRRILFVGFDELDAVEADDEGSILRTQRGAVSVNEGFGAVLRRLPPERFAAVNRSTAVNLQRIASIEARSHGDMRVRLHSGAEYTLTRTHRTMVLARLQPM